MGRGGGRGRLVPLALVLGLALGTAAPTAALADEADDARREARVAQREAREAEREAAREAKEAEREAIREERRKARAQLDAARADLRRAESALSSARGATRAARAAGGAAEGQRRAAEDALAPSIIEHLRAEEAYREARLRVRALREDLLDTEEELERARLEFDDRVVRAYKQGSIAAHTTLPLSIFREVSSPGELATAMKDLEAVAGFGAIRVHEVAEELVRLEAQLVSALAEREDTEQEVQRTAALIDAREDDAAVGRSRAATAEANLLAAVRRELEAERAVERAKPPVERARANLERVRAGDDAPPTESRPQAADVAAADDEAGASPAQWIANRERALARQEAVPPERRRAAADWICPVEGSRFVNDWGFPRSQERRHEGTDVFADEGTPIVAAVDAEVVAVNHVDRFNGRSGFGGLTVSYEVDGVRYYNAHLQRIKPGLEVGDQLEAGEVLGWVGRTGNARGTPPHLHLGVYVDDVAVNPYPSLAVACAPDGRPTGDDEDAELLAELDERRAAREQRRAERAERGEEDGTRANRADGDDARTPPRGESDG